MLTSIQVLLFLHLSPLLLYLIQHSLFRTQKILCLANYRGSCTALNQRLGVTALTKPVGKPVAEAAAFHSISSWTEYTTTSSGQALKVKVFIKLTLQAGCFFLYIFQNVLSCLPPAELYRPYKKINWYQNCMKISLFIWNILLSAFTRTLFASL